MADIFLSYTEADRDAVRRLALALQSVGWSVWWDRRIPAGKTWRSVLEQELQGMRCMVVVWSAKSVQSEWVCEEAAEGRQAGKLIPVMLEKVRPPAGFRELQAADLIGWDGSADFPGLQQLIEDIGRLVYQPSVGGAAVGTPDPPAMPNGNGPVTPPRPPEPWHSPAEPPVPPVPAGPPGPPGPSPAPAPPLPPLAMNWWVWGAAATALLAAAIVGYFAEHWRQGIPTQVPGVATKALPGVGKATVPSSVAAPGASESPSHAGAGTAKSAAEQTKEAPASKPPAVQPLPVSPSAPSAPSTASGLPAPAKAPKNAMASGHVAVPAPPTAIKPQPPLTAAGTAQPTAARRQRCEALRERMQMGEALTEESQTYYRQEC